MWIQFEVNMRSFENHNEIHEIFKRHYFLIFKCFWSGVQSALLLHFNSTKNFILIFFLVQLVFFLLIAFWKSLFAHLLLLLKQIRYYVTFQSQFNFKLKLNIFPCLFISALWYLFPQLFVFLKWLTNNFTFQFQIN